MTYQDIVMEVIHLPIQQRMALIETVIHSMREELTPINGRKNEFSAEYMRGILKPDGPLPSDEALKIDYINYLERRYA